MRLKGGFQALGLPTIVASILFSIISYIIPTQDGSYHFLFHYPNCLGSRVLRPRIELQILGFGVILGYIGIMEKKMEATIACWGHIWRMEQ